MSFKDSSEVIELIKKNQAVPAWVSVARKESDLLKALVTGEKFNDVLINRIENIESASRAVSRKKYSKNIVDMLSRTMNPRSAVFNAFGGSVRNRMTTSNLDTFTSLLSKFKGQKSIKKYLSENLFRWMDSDPNSVIFMEYVEDEDIYPTYKSINDIRNYESDGQLLKYIVFEPKEVNTGNEVYMIWRVVDGKTDYRIKQRGMDFTEVEELTFDHPFGVVPAVITSDMQVTGSEKRITPIFDIVPLSEDYARDKSIKTIYKFQNGFPRHWRYEKECRACNGTGKTGEDHSACNTCGGEGHLRKNDVTDVDIIPVPLDNEDPLIAPHVAGFVSPDLATWSKMSEELVEIEDTAFNTIWGTKRVKKGGNETATGRFIDVQPIMVKLDDFADNAEWIHNKLAHFVENWLNGAPKEEFDFFISYGRRFIIESPDAILERYTEARDKGDNSTILDKLLDEYILSNYRNNPIMIDEMQKKRQVEPYVHQDIDQVNLIFGTEEANRIVLFPDFWSQADISRTVEELKVDFEQFVSNDLASKELTEAERTRKLISQLSPLIATKILESMSEDQVLELVGLEKKESNSNN